MPSPRISPRYARPNGLSTASGPSADLRRCWVTYRATLRVAIANSRLVAIDDADVTFQWKDYRTKGRERAKLMTLAVDESSAACTSTW
jgi:hypothetical protein